MINTFISFLSFVLLLPISAGFLLILFLSAASLAAALVAPVWLKYLNGGHATN